MSELFKKVHKGPARTEARKLRMSSNLPNTKRTLRRRRALERLEHDIARYAAMPQTNLILRDEGRAKAGEPFTVANKLEKAREKHAALLRKPGMV